VLRILDVVAIVTLFANAYILGSRAFDLANSGAHGEFLALRSLIEVFWSTVAAAYLAWRFKSLRAPKATP